MPKTMTLLAGTLALALGTRSTHAQTPIPPSPQDFLLGVAQSDHYEIMAAHLAAVQGQDQRVRDFAHKVVEDHTEIDADLRQAAMASKLPLPPQAMSSDQAMLLSGLQGLRDGDFDKAYARQQEVAHAQAVAVMGSFVEAGKDENLKAVAKAALPKIEDHMRMAKELGSALGGS